MTCHIEAENIAALPAAPGVYVFRGATALPLYIGKSVNIRSRVLAHLRSTAQAKMIAQAWRVDFCRTAGEIGALLLEARWIKEQRPLYNIRLRQSRTLYAWRLAGDPAKLAPQAPQLIAAGAVDLAHATDLYGPYLSRHAAHEQLRRLADEHGLCLASLGLEKRGLRGCFRAQLGRCRGVCAGREAAEAHDARLHLALAAQRVQCWPHAGAVGIIEQDAGLEQVHWVQNWCYLGTTSGPHHATPQRVAAFDLDTYRILVRPLLSRSLQIRQATAPGAKPDCRAGP
jgi:excinuclease Cho